MARHYPEIFNPIEIEATKARLKLRARFIRAGYVLGAESSPVRINMQTWGGNTIEVRYA